MAQLVSAGGAEFYVELADGGGPTTVGDRGALSFDGVRATVEGIAAELAGVWRRVQPSEASVEFGLRVTARSGKLTGLMVDAGGEAALTVTLTWKKPENDPAVAVPGPAVAPAPAADAQESGGPAGAAPGAG